MRKTSEAFQGTDFVNRYSLVAPSQLRRVIILDRKPSAQTKPSPPSEGDLPEVSASEDGTGDGVEVAPMRSKLRRRSKDKIVSRATRGLIRRESRRRLRSAFRWALYFVVAGALLFALWNYWADQFPTDIAKAYWEDIKDKVLSAMPSVRETP